MSWLFSQALVEEYLGDISLDGEPSAPLNGNHTQQAYCALDKMTDFSRLSRFGMTYKPLTENRGEELLTSYRAAFHAKTSPQPEPEMDSTVSALECGERWQGSLAKYDPNTSSWKTHQCSLAGDLEEFSETWPKWGSMRNGVCWEREIFKENTKETEFGSLPTPVATDWMAPSKATASYQDGRFIRTSKTSGKVFGLRLSAAYHLMTGNLMPPSFSEWMMGWPLGWTDLKPLETDKFQLWLKKHGKS